jgi:L-ascorbate metabolism protein UlaG (beta-lactamase superfamily)
MHITKHQHACVVIEHEGKKLIIDPGVFTKDLGKYDNVAAVVITHVHPDHLDPVQLAAIAAAQPDIPIYSTQEVASQIAAPQVTVVDHGDVQNVASFTLDFFGGQHARIHESIPANQNIGVMVNGSFYYPGDSFAMPDDAEVAILALPVSAPWLKIAESIDFLAGIKPRTCFPTHNAILSPEGQGIVDRLIGNACQTIGTTYVPLQPGESIDDTPA